ncbi:hypothetical protein K1T71_007957 [Dendrolimus kikuchii]|uniref:Uncharacterized protein n=1 Tax=Dendrolimus kikuchii TaxID=765133 RepID=A0ACC1CYQ4_9NEOP|nr:hypothetical protein K1T71_007957 [Dendrolimus kikuchii]
MDRFVTREPRANTDYPQGNQIIAYTPTAGSSRVVPPENMYCPGNYGAEFPNIQRMISSSYAPISHVINTPTSYPQTNPGSNLLQGPTMSGIDHRYLAGYSDNSAQYIITGQQMNGIPDNVQPSPGFGADYQNRNVIGPDRNRSQTFTPKLIIHDARKQQETRKCKETNVANASNRSEIEDLKPRTNGSNRKRKDDVEVTKNEIQNQIVTRGDKLKALFKTGPRVFSGPVEKVLKWHKFLQDIGILILYEVVAKCVSIRPGESRAKNLVVRDDNGPAMQVVYYEIDFLLPDIIPPCTVRVIGRMLAGSSRLQAFNVRLASGEDVMMLPRRAAIAEHHVSKLHKEYGNHP